MVMVHKNVNNKDNINNNIECTEASTLVPLTTKLLYSSVFSKLLECILPFRPTTSDACAHFHEPEGHMMLSQLHKSSSLSRLGTNCLEDLFKSNVYFHTVCVCVCVCVCVERERERQTDRQTDKQTETETERQRKRHYRQTVMHPNLICQVREEVLVTIFFQVLKCKNKYFSKRPVFKGCGEVDGQ